MIEKNTTTLLLCISGLIIRKKKFLLKIYKLFIKQISFKLYYFIFISFF